MGKMSEADFQELSARLRARAIAIMQQLDAKPGSTGSSGAAPAATRVSACATCGTVNDTDARFCKQCGGKLG
jgi:membrane protease subunit (stomatin/prohibitin family)